MEDLPAMDQRPRQDVLGNPMDCEELLSRLSRLRRAQVGNQRVPHKPLLLLWLFGRFATTGTTLASYREAEEPVSRLINDFGPPVTRA
jgi:putative restriction endonuclease